MSERQRKLEDISSERDNLKSLCEKLKGYVRHAYTCDAEASMLYPRPCSCGLDELLKQGEK